MDNPWATTWDQPDDRDTNLPSTLSLRSPIVDQTHEQEEDLGLPSWSSGNDAQWSGPSHTSSDLWTSSVDDSRAWGSSTYSKINLSRQGTVQAVLESETQQDDLVPAPLIPATAIAREEDSISPPVSSDTVEPPLALPTVEAVLVPESPDIFGGFEAVVSTKEENEETEDGGEAWADPIAVSTEDDDDWGAAWAETSSQEASVSTEEPPDEWEAARQEKEKLNRAVPPEFLASLIQNCRDISGEIWPETKPDSDATQSNWRTGFDGLKNITVLLNDLVPENMSLPPPVQFSQTATAKAVNNSLKLTRHMPLTRKSPMALLLASKGSMEWEKSVRARKDAPADDTPVGWRILEKDERVAIAEATPKKPGGGLLSFLNRRVSSIPLTDPKVEVLGSSPRSSVEGTKPPVPERRDGSPARAPAVVVPSSPIASSSTTPDIVIPMVTPAPSAVSRFLNRFSRAKGTGSERKSLALSTDDLEFLSDIVPNAYDPYDDNDDPQLKALSNMINSNSLSISNSTPLPPKLPPPLAPPPKPPSVNTSRPPSFTGLTGLDITLEPARGTPPTPARTPSLPPPLSPATVTSFSRPHSPAVPTKQSPIKAVFPVYSNPNISATVTTIPSSSQPPSRTHTPFQLSPLPKAPSTLSIPPLLPPPPVSPPQTPRPVLPPTSVATSSTSTSKPGWTNSAWSTAYHDDDDDDSFSAFSSLPRRDAFPQPRESIESSLGSPSSAQALNSKSSTSMSFDDFDDFVTSSSSQIRTPSPPPVPAKPKPANVLPGGGAGAGVGVGARMASSRTMSVSIHQRTQSLLEHAASQRGQWPSPKHPTPLLLPSSGFASFSSDMDLLGDSDSMQSLGSPPPSKGQSAVVHHQLSPSPSPPLVSQQPLSFASLSPSSRAPRPPAEPVQKGGLTAQDLSFFEGF